LRKTYRNNSVTVSNHTNKNTTVSEKALQSQVVSCLTVLGYTVFETGKARGKTKCSTCGAYSYATGWQGNTLGVPDLYVHNSQWKTPIGIGIELKTKTGAVTKFWEKANFMTKKVCISQAFRLCFSDELGGMPYTIDEMQPEEITQDIAHVEVIEVPTLTDAQLKKVLEMTSDKLEMYLNKIEQGELNATQIQVLAIENKLKQ